MGTNDWLEALLDDTSDVLSDVVPARFASVAAALVEATVCTTPLGAQLVGELADRAPTTTSGTVTTSEREPSDDNRPAAGKGGRA